MNTNPILVLILSLLPGVLWLWFFYRQDKYEKEPKSLIAKCFIFGAVTVIPVGTLESPFRGYLEGRAGFVGLLAITIFVVGLFEELAKYLAMRIAAYGKEEFNETIDGVVYGVSVGLGFASLENILYMSAFGPEVGAVRAILTNLAHASFSGIVGYYLGLAKFNAVMSKRLIFKGLAIAIAIHGVYDFFVIGRILSPVYAVVIILLTYVYLRGKIRKALVLSPFSDDNPTS